MSGVAFGRTGRGLVWTGLERAFVQVLAFMQGVVLARLLCPEDFGLVAMIGIFLSVGAALAESGLGMALVVRGGDERRAFLWNVSAGVALYLLLCACAPLIAAFYRQPVLRPLVWVMGLVLVVQSAGCVPIARLTRMQQFAELALTNGVSAVVAAAAAVTSAGLGAGVWSIAACGLWGAAMRTGLAWWLSMRVPMCGEADAAGFRALLKLGGGYLVSGLIHTLYLNLYELVLGRLQGPVSVGLFNRSSGWVAAARNSVNPTVERVAFPQMALAARSRGGRQRRICLKFGLLNIVLLWPVMVALWIWADEIVGCVFGAQWLSCVPYLRILILGQLCSPLANIALCVLRAKGRADLILRTDAIKKPLGFAALACGLPFGLTGVCWAKVASDVFEALTDMAFVAKDLIGWQTLDLAYRLKRDLRPLLWEFRLMTARPGFGPGRRPDYWCMYLVALLACGEDNRFGRIWKRYLARGGDVRKFSEYFPLAEVAVKRGCAEPSVVSASETWRRLRARHADCPLARLVCGKRVAVVGNGPQELGKGLGVEIDSHDVVIRMNNYELEPCARDYGTRTDVWVKNVTPGMKHALPSQDICLVLYNGNWERDRLEYGFGRCIAEDLARGGIMVDYLDTQDRAETVDAIGGLPTTGALVIGKLRGCGCLAVDAYGFSFLGQGASGPYVRLPRDVPPETLAQELACHKWREETVYLSGLFEGRRLKS